MVHVTDDTLFLTKNIITCMNFHQTCEPRLFLHIPSGWSNNIFTSIFTQQCWSGLFRCTCSNKILKKIIQNILIANYMYTGRATFTEKLVDHAVFELTKNETQSLWRWPPQGFAKILVIEHTAVAVAVALAVSKMCLTWRLVLVFIRGPMRLYSFAPGLDLLLTRK